MGSGRGADECGDSVAARSEAEGLVDALSFSV
jgi:hypothetical protein